MASSMLCPATNASIAATRTNSSSTASFTARKRRNLHRRAHILRQQTSLLEQYSVADQITAAYVPRRLCALRASPFGDVLPPALRFQNRVMCDSRTLAASNNSSLPSVILPMMSFSLDWYIFGVSPNSAPASLPSCRPGTRARITQSLPPEERRNFSIGMAVNEREASRPALWWPCARDRLVRTGALDAIINLTMET
ncbi:hypothetical protein GA0061099_101525 [Bradyrhizobium yuanmingense]|uniref:Uncharacterized protein n=1 Tax=Bradyrhizobium yuanmingense TaxID=108015 RepID=A0A1C3XGM4_9BRAD|nr:hypothetical protein IQ15_06937 [Bradyrhizobium yuanmingense]SCB51124.1 hypothetical protein GA0061099_101525 [Bradyrhizobium yuanmingense]